MKAITVQHIIKNYEQVLALNDIMLEVDSGEIFGLIGPDGAGKTSLIRILATLIKPDSGESFINGMHVVKEYKQIRKVLGYMPSRFSLYMDLTVEENLNFYASVFNASVKENYHLIEPIYKYLEPFKTRKARQLSGGMKQKLALSCALIHKPEVLLLDEPTTGVDAVSRVEFWEMLAYYKKLGITVFVSTPYMDEAKRCNRLALIKEGNILTISQPDQIIRSYPDFIYEISQVDAASIVGILKKLYLEANIFRFGSLWHISNKYELPDIKLDLKNEGFKEALVRKIEPTMEDCFLSITENIAVHDK